jgi:DNA-binding LacI/PurR family transcriptional regulator
VSMQRTQGAIHRLHDLGVTDITEAAGDYTYKSGRKALQEVLDVRGSLPDAIICANDIMAIGAMDEARYKMDLDVPGDISIVGFDGVRSASWSSFDLTTIQQPVESMAEAAVSMLLERVENEQLPPEKRSFSGVLRKGTSIRE